MNFNDTLSRLQAHRGDPSITITTNAAHTYMEAELVREHLKKLEHHAEELLLQHYEKRIATPVIERSRALVAGLNRVDDRPGLALFVNRDIAEVVHLPFVVNERVTVGASFNTRELLRTGLDSITYHVLLLSADHARLYEADDAHVVKEIRGVFPMRNKHYTTDAVQVTTTRGQENQERRFHQEVDAAVRQVAGPRSIVVVACVAGRFGAFMSAVERADIYHGNVPGNFDHVPEREMVRKAWEVVHAEQKRRHLAELEKSADGTPARFCLSVSEIWSAVTEGRGKVLFLERDKHQMAVPRQDRMVLVEEGMDHEPGIDLVDAIIEEHVERGGEVRILPNGSMAKYDGIALKLRY